MKRFLYLSLISLAFGACKKEVWMFSSFHEPAQEGLRLLYSYDGYAWKDLNKTFLKPEVGNQKVMADPPLHRVKTASSIWSGPAAGKTMQVLVMPAPKT
ncbi:MAG: hypothetical protein R2822_21300 [Spirosomataceae bacterium]